MILDKYTKIYEKTVGGLKKLYASVSGTPSVSDNQLTFKKNDGTTISDEDINNKEVYRFFYEKIKNIFSNSSSTGIPTDSDTQINVFIDGEKLFGSDFFTISFTGIETAAFKYGSSSGDSIDSGSSVAKGSKIYVVAETSEDSLTATIKVGSANATPFTLTKGEDDKYRGSFVVEDTTTITFTESSNTEQQDS